MATSIKSVSDRVPTRSRLRLLRPKVGIPELPQSDRLRRVLGRPAYSPWNPSGVFTAPNSAVFGGALGVNSLRNVSEC